MGRHCRGEAIVRLEREPRAEECGSAVGTSALTLPPAHSPRPPAQCSPCRALSGLALWCRGCHCPQLADPTAELRSWVWPRDCAPLSWAASLGGKRGIPRAGHRHYNLLSLGDAWTSPPLRAPARAGRGTVLVMLSCSRLPGTPLCCSVTGKDIAPQMETQPLLCGCACVHVRVRACACMHVCAYVSVYTYEHLVGRTEEEGIDRGLAYPSKCQTCHVAMLVPRGGNRLDRFSLPRLGAH